MPNKYYSNHQASQKIYTSEKLSKHLINSKNFTSLFQQSISLISDTASYLDTEGRNESRKMSHKNAMTYARESMLLTSKLIQLVSWLLMHKSVGNNEVTLEEAYSEKNRILLTAWSEYCIEDVRKLPEKMQDLIIRSEIIYQNIKRMDNILVQYASKLTNDSMTKTNSIMNDIERLRSVFNQ